MEDIKEIDIIITLIAGTLVMFIMAAVIVMVVIKYQKRRLKDEENLRLVEKKFQNDLLDATISSAEKEREIVAKNMHDEIGTLINVIKLNTGRLKNEITNQKVVLEIIETNNQLLKEIDESVRTISNDLMSPTLHKLGFMKGIKQLCLQINNSNSIKISADFEATSIRFNSKTEIQLFRICKEVINNILKHSNSNEIYLSFNIESNNFIISITYNGKGINNDEVKKIMNGNKGLGLKSIYGRVQILKGEIDYSTDAGEPANVFIKVPIE